jgi:glycosyltransferase involved in cell wall biosynthesis
MKNKHILIISFAYPPLSTMGARRISKTSKILLENGYIPHIITAKNIKPKNSTELEIPIELVHYVDWPDIWKLIERFEKSKIGGMISKGLKKIIPSQTNSWPEFRAYWWISKATKKAFKIITEYDIELIFSSFTPPASVRIASRIKKKTNLPWVNEYRDLWTLNPYNRKNLLLRIINEKIEKKLIKNSNALITVSEPLKRDIIKLHNKKTYVIYNGYDKLDISEVKNNDFLNIVYTGVIYKGKRDPEPLFEALQLLKDENYQYYDKIKINFWGFQIPKQLKPLVDKYNLQNIVFLNNEVSHNSIEEIQKKAHILLLLGWNNPKDAGVVTGKLFEYIGMKKEILSISYPLGAINEILNETGLGKVIVNKNEIAEFIKQKMNSYVIEAGIKKMNFDQNEIVKYSRENQVKELIKIFETLIS